jgi:SAM-dependent methyltransferase
LNAVVQSDLGTTLRNCGLCMRRTYRMKYAIQGYRIGRCEGCGLVQVIDNVDEATLAGLYGKSYYEGENSYVYPDYLANSDIKTRDYELRLSRICAKNNISRPGSCLEIGCAFGLFLNVAKHRGWNTTGIELSEHSAAYARDHFGLDVSSQPNALQKLPTESHNLVVMWDVIEHLKDPLKTLTEVRRILTRDGLLVLSTGDIGSLGARLYGKRWHLIAPPYHLFYFDRRTIRRMLADAGFEVCDISSDGHPLDNHGNPRLLAWVASRDRYIGWRLNSGPIMTVAASVSLRLENAVKTHP